MDNIEVSVFCLAYNCVDFIEKAIEGMVCQKTSFNYKIIIHDDASTDGTAEIIQRKAEEYPEKIYAILQKENQYSKGVSIRCEYIEPNIEGDFLAICEGDDCWIHSSKLQIQYDFMKAHPECSLCTHNTIDYNLKSGRKRFMNHWENCHELTEEDVFLNRCVHTSSYFLRRDGVQWPGKQYWFGDYMMLTWAFYKGVVFSLPQIMSVYNRNNENGIMRQISRKGVYEANKRRRMQIDYLQEFNQITQSKYDSMINRTCRCIEYFCCKEECDYIIRHSKSKKECIDAAKKMISQEYYREYLGSRRGLALLRAKCSYEGYVCYPLWKMIRRFYLAVKDWKYGK